MFNVNTFNFAIKSDPGEMRLNFQAFKIIEFKESGNTDSELFGDCVLELKQLKSHLFATDSVTQSLRFSKSKDFSREEDPDRYNIKDTTDTTVGRFNVTLAMVEDLRAYGNTLLQ